MPFTSEKQRKWMWANKPEMAKKWEEESKKKKKDKEKYANLNKIAVEIVSKKRTAPLVHGFLTRMIYGKDELAPPDKRDLERWQRIADYMTAAAPAQLNTAKVLTGPVSATNLVNQIHAHKDYDTFLEDLAGTRESTAIGVSGLPNAQMEQMPALYFPHANTAMVQERSPGVLIHELGHGVDMARRDKETNFKRWLRWKLKPLLWEELSAWKKGRKAYQQGFAASGEHKNEKLLNEYLENMVSYNSRKYPAFGTYVGGALGTTAGVAGGLAAGLAANDPGAAQMFALLGATAGGALGIVSGLFAGKLWAHLRTDANKQKALKQLHAFIDKGDLEKIKANLVKAKQLSSKAKKRKKK